MRRLLFWSLFWSGLVLLLLALFFPYWFNQQVWPLLMSTTSNAWPTVRSVLSGDTGGINLNASSLTDTSNYLATSARWAVTLFLGLVFLQIFLWFLRKSRASVNEIYGMSPPQVRSNWWTSIFVLISLVYLFVQYGASIFTSLPNLLLVVLGAAGLLATYKLVVMGGLFERIGKAIAEIAALFFIIAGITAAFAAFLIVIFNAVGVADGGVQVASFLTGVGDGYWGISWMMDVIAMMAVGLSQMDVQFKIVAVVMLYLAVKSYLTPAGNPQMGQPGMMPPQASGMSPEMIQMLQQQQGRRGRR